MVSSQQQVQIETVCNQGIEAYLSQKHKEVVKSSIEIGAMSGFLGVLTVLGISYFFKESGAKPVHAAYPALAGLIGGLITATVKYNDYDKQHKEDFETVCKSVISE